MIRLEPLGAQHLALIEAVLADDETLRFTRIPVSAPEAFARTWLSRYDEDGRAGFAIVAGGAEVGLALAPALDRDTRTAELGYIVLPGARGRGIATAALARLSDWALAEGMLRLELVIDVENAPSKRVAERCGYEREGVLRSAHVKQGIRADVELWSRLAS
ncbi:MAG TPA: GNAT family N-acetyltransferase [Gaiellaceae bacterium]|nr:GNAT family N-acetyltransferase [Gaiellaceae bacterium]